MHDLTRLSQGVRACRPVQVLLHVLRRGCAPALYCCLKKEPGCVSPGVAQSALSGCTSGQEQFKCRFWSIACCYMHCAYRSFPKALALLTVPRKACSGEAVSP